MKRVIMVAFLLVWSAAPSRAQEIGSYDFTSVQPRNRLRPPAKRKHKSTLVEGMCAGIGDNGLQVELLSLDRPSYVPGDDFVYTLRIRNIGRNSQSFPLAATLGDVEPAEPRKSYSYTSAAIWLEMQDDDGHSLEYKPHLALYQSPETASTSVILGPGEWITLRARGRLEASMTKQGDKVAFAPGVPRAFKVRAWLFSGGAEYLFNASTRQEIRRCHLVLENYAPVPDPVNAPRVVVNAH